MKKEKRGIAARIGTLLAQSVSTIRMRGTYRIEVEGNGTQMRALVSGADRILLCNEEEVSLRSGRSLLRFEGCGLSCLTYEGGIAEIEGRITGFFSEEIN